MKYLFLFFFFSQSLFAQDFEVSPVLIEANASQGRFVRDVMIFNHTDSPKIFNVKEYDFIIEEGGKRMPAEFGSTSHTLKGEMNISPSTILLQPNEKGYFTLSIEPVIASKMKWAKLSVIAENEVSVLEEVTSLGAGVKIKPAISIMVYMHSDEAQPDAEIFTPEKTDLGYDVRIANTGDARVKAKVTFLLTNILTGEEMEFDEEVVNLLPGAEKTLSIVIPEHDYAKAMLSVLMDYSPNADLKGVQTILN